jgi:hypothetical protein
MYIGKIGVNIPRWPGEQKRFLQDSTGPFTQNKYEDFLSKQNNYKIMIYLKIVIINNAPIEY